MTQLTQAYLDKALKTLPSKQDVEEIVDKRIKHLPSKQDVERLLTEKTRNLPDKQNVQAMVDDAIENLARIVNAGFEGQQAYLEEKLDVRDRMAVLEQDMVRIKEALRIK